MLVPALLVALLGPLAHASAPQASAPVPTEALAEISEGDRAWWSGDRGAAYAAWRRALVLALAAAAESPDTQARPATRPPERASAQARAAEAMARVRLLQLGGTTAPFVHEARLNAALANCPTTEPWCVIAAADWELFMPAFTGANPARVPELLAGSPLPGPAAARITVATGDQTALDALPTEALDGMGAGMRQTRRIRPPAPGTWVLGLGVGGAPGAGVGLTVRFVHPDLAWRGHRLEVTAGGDSRLGFSVASSLRTATRPGWVFGVSGARVVADRWEGDVATPYALGTLRGYAAVAPRWQDVTLLAGASVRADWIDGAAYVAGPLAAVTLGDLTRDGARVTVDTSFGTYTHLALSGEWRAHPPLEGGELAIRLAGTHVPTASPFYRLPTAGGADLLRGLPAGRFRAPTVLAAQAEYRRVLVGPLHGAAFVDTAWVDGPHVTAGLGVRLVLPPARENVTRLDIGFGPEGWGVVAAWGDAF